MTEQFRASVVVQSVDLTNPFHEEEGVLTCRTTVWSGDALPKSHEIEGCMAHVSQTAESMQCLEAAEDTLPIRYVFLAIEKRRRGRIFGWKIIQALGLDNPER